MTNRDGNLDSAVSELEGLLENSITSLISSNRGEWPSGNWSQNPFVCFSVAPKMLRKWQLLQQRVFTSVLPLISDRSTIYVEESYELPKALESKVCWRFQARIRDDTWTLFRSEREWQETMAQLVRTTSKELRRELEVLS